MSYSNWLTRSKILPDPVTAPEFAFTVKGKFVINKDPLPPEELLSVNWKWTITCLPILVYCPADEAVPTEPPVVDKVGVQLPSS